MKVKKIAAEHLHLERVMMLRGLEKKALEIQRVPKLDPKPLTIDTQAANLAVSTQSVRDKLNAMALKNLSPRFDDSLKPDEVPKLTTFELFKRLAPELRVKIWDIILRDMDARVVEVMWDAEKEEYYASCDWSVLLHVNRESRAEVLRRYAMFVVENPVKEATTAMENANNRARGNAFADPGGAGNVDGEVAATFEIENQAAGAAAAALRLDNGEATEVVPNYSSRSFGAYINFNKDLLYLSLGSFTREGKKFTEKMIDFLSKIDTITATKLQKIAFEPPLHPFNTVLQTMTRFSDLQICAGVKSDVCLSYINPGHLNPAPHLPAIGFIRVEPEMIGESSRWSVQYGGIEHHSTDITWETFKAKLARLKSGALTIGISREWIDKVEFVTMDIMRDQEQEPTITQDV